MSMTDNDPAIVPQDPMRTLQKRDLLETIGKLKLPGIRQDNDPVKTTTP